MVDVYTFAIAALTSLSANGVDINREEWMNDAIACEKSNSVLTCQAIIRSVIGHGLDEHEMKDTWLEDAESVSVYNTLIFSCFYFYQLNWSSFKLIH